MAKTAQCYRMTASRIRVRNRVEKNQNHVFIACAKAGSC